jgi:hypothetical protein
MVSCGIAWLVADGLAAGEVGAGDVGAGDVGAGDVGLAEPDADGLLAAQPPTRISAVQAATRPVPDLAFGNQPSVPVISR